MNHYLPITDIPLLRLPSTRRSRRASRQRGIIHLGQQTSAQLLHASGIDGCQSLFFLGRPNRAYPLIRQLVHLSSLPACIIGTKKDLSNGCLAQLGQDWTLEHMQKDLPSGSGTVMLSQVAPSDRKQLSLFLPSWNNHFIILCLGTGIQLDKNMLNTIFSLESCCLITTSPIRSVCGDLSSSDLLAAMPDLIITSCSDSDLSDALPKFRSEKNTNHLTFSFHRDRPHSQHHFWEPKHHGGGGLILGQDWTSELRPLLDDSELKSLCNHGALAVIRREQRQAWTAFLTD